MSKVAHLNRKPKKTTPTFFSRWELQQLLNLYSQQVANGEWRDYAINQHSGMVVFSVFRHTMEQPLYAVAKRGQGSEYIVYSGPEKLKRAATLNDALAVLRKRAQVRAIT
jgi:hypothetical protein